ncbi:MAG: Na+/H+ antiporter [Anaerolineales bacterium]|nr:Na+/H+ antiporter [Anaerolineae bacterium]PWB69431.1 MAG: Na+/H+ antiporter [Anaerolineales bacterium]
MIGESIIIIEEIIIGLLLIASVVAITARQLRLPYTVGLVLIGLALTFLTATEVNISPQIILALLVPPLVFEAAFHIRLDDLRRDFWLILTLAVPGVIITTLLVGVVVAWGTGLALSAALVFGALISATDPVSVVALFRRLGVPRRVQLLLEGESLFNDGTAIVMFSIMLGIASAGTFDFVSGLRDFIRIAGGGVLIGVALGTLISQFINRIDDPLVETTLTTVLAFGSYLIAESLGVSGVLAVVAAGIVNGNVDPAGMSATTRVVVFNFWEYAAFLANSLVFLLIGLSTDVKVMVANWQAIVWAVIAVVTARAVSIYGFSSFNRDISLKWKHVLFWGGLRGAIALALALSLPETGPLVADRGSLQAMAFGLVLFSLLVQGSSADWFVRRLKLVERSNVQEEYERRHARFVAGRAAQDYIRRMSQQGVISEHTWQRLAPLLEKRTAGLAEAVKEVVTSDPMVEAEELDTARRESLRAQRAALTGLLRDGVISEEIYSQLVGEVDSALTTDHTVWPGLDHSGIRPRLKLDRLMTVFVQEQDAENAVQALTKLGVSVTRLPSRGGFLRRGNITLMIGLPAAMVDTVVRAIKNSCRWRVEYVNTFLPTSNLPMPRPIEVKIGGATVFVFEVEKFVEF